MTQIYQPQSSHVSTITQKGFCFVRLAWLLHSKPRSQNDAQCVLKSPDGSYRGQNAPIPFHKGTLVLGLMSPVGRQRVNNETQFDQTR